MTIGIIGTGAIGQTFCRQVLKAGYQVIISNSRGPESLSPVVRELGAGVRAGSVKEAAAAHFAENLPDTPRPAAVLHCAGAGSSTSRTERFAFSAGTGTERHGSDSLDSRLSESRLCRRSFERRLKGEIHGDYDDR